MRRWIFAWLGYWRDLYVRGASLLFVLALMWVGSFTVGVPLWLLGEALWPAGGLGLVLVSVTVFPICAGIALRLFRSKDDPQSPPNWSMYKLGLPLRR